MKNGTRNLLVIIFISLCVFCILFFYWSHKREEQAIRESVLMDKIHRIYYRQELIRLDADDEYLYFFQQLRSGTGYIHICDEGYSGGPVGKEQENSPIAHWSFHSQKGFKGNTHWYFHCLSENYALELALQFKWEPTPKDYSTWILIKKDYDPYR